MTSASLLFALGSSLAFAGCSHASGSAPVDDDLALAETTAARQPLIIGAFKTHDGKVSILGGRSDKELRVMVEKDDGTIVADAATLDELRAKDPGTWHVVTSALARAGGESGTYLDATLDARPAAEGSLRR